MCWSS